MVADFNNDGDLDAAVANYCIDNSCTGSIAVFLGNGDGTFRPGSEITTPQLTNTIATGDFNGDGYADLASTSYYGHLIVLLNRGDGYFDLTHDYADSSVRFIGYCR